MWLFFGTKHGKGPHKGIGSIFKQYIWTTQLDSDGSKLQYAANIIAFLNEELNKR